MIKQAIIPLAGLGTRMLPLTSVIPKELLPINGRPNLEYILDECLEAGIKEFIFIIHINMNILITCPPMICQIKSFDNTFKKNNIIYHIPECTALMSEAELIDIIDRFDGWIAGDDPVSENVLKKGYQHKLKIVVKWGIGTDNIDYSACKKYGIKIFNTPGVFNDAIIIALLTRALPSFSL